MKSRWSSQQFLRVSRSPRTKHFKNHYSRVAIKRIEKNVLKLLKEAGGRDNNNKLSKSKRRQEKRKK